MKQNLSMRWFIIVSLCLFTSALVCAVPVAFPGAEGSGRFATGGRGGDVYEVTNLSNSGPGSIVDAVSAGNRTIVFRISGTIELGDVILRPKSNTTIAGQTAPGDGICLKGRIYIGSVSDVVIRYIRVRVDEGGANSDGDAIDIASGNNIIIDHVSASYARDETISCQDGSDNITVQWCIMSEALNFEDHSYGSLIRGEYGEEKTYHHNLYAHNRGRNPRPGNYTSTSQDPEGLHCDFRNNVMYNWAGSQPGYNADTSTTSRYNFVGNVSIAGPESNVTGWAFEEKAVDAYAYWSGNAYGTNYASVSVPSDQWSLVRFSGFDTAEITAYKARSYEIPMEPVTTTSAAQALEDVLDGAGASLARDSIDARIVNEVRTGTVTYYGSKNGLAGIIDYTSDLADPWPTLSPGTAPTDTDHDGMPDAWEIANGLNETNPADRNYYDLHLDYTNLEVYLNSLVADDLEAPLPPENLTVDAGNGAVNLDWDTNPETDLAGYNVYRSTTSASGYIRLNTTAVSDSEYTDETAENWETYFYVVTAVDRSANESDFSDEVFATPIDLNHYGDTNGDLYVDITDLPDFLAVWLESDCLTTSGWDINDDCVVNYDEFGLLASLWRLDNVAPGIPTGLQSDSGDFVVILEWDANPESDLYGYNVYRSTASGGEVVQLNTTPLGVPAYTDTDVVNGTTYYYVITALDTALNESGYSNEISAMPGPLNSQIIIQEDETGFCGIDADGEVEIEHPGYTGSGYANTDNETGAGINYSINILSPGTYSFVFRYAGETDRPADLIVNGFTEVSDISFPSTGAWDTWSTTAPVQVTLSSGLKTIRLEAADDDGLVNIDYMQISGPNLQAAACP